MDERLGIAGSGAIACGLAATASLHGGVVLWARSEQSADRAGARLAKVCGRLEELANVDNVRVDTELSALAGCSAIVEAVVEEHDAKAALLKGIVRTADSDALIATTTSSLSVGELAAASGVPDRFVGLHVFNPVPRMQLVELAFAEQATVRTRERAHALCVALGKTAVDVPDTPGFVVNRLLFPYLFSAVDLMVASDLTPEAVDTCMTLGAGHPMGPLALLDFVGLDVSLAIGEAIGAEVPARLRELVGDGALGRKSKRGFYTYDD